MPKRSSWLLILAVSALSGAAAAAPASARKDQSSPEARAVPADPLQGDTSPADTPGFRITVPLCRDAERQSDPLARTPECVQLLNAAAAQARACRKAFEDGDDQKAMSAACRQGAGFR